MSTRASSKLSAATTPAKKKGAEGCTWSKMGPASTGPEIRASAAADSLSPIFLPWVSGPEAREISALIVACKNPLPTAIPTAPTMSTAKPGPNTSDDGGAPWVLAVVVAFVPARKAARLNPVTALSFE